MVRILHSTWPWSYHAYLGRASVFPSVVNWVDEDSRKQRLPVVSTRMRRGVLLAGGGVVAKAGVELPLRDPVRVEVCGQGGDVPHVGVVHKGSEVDGAAMEELVDLDLPPVRRDGAELDENRDQVAGFFQHVDANLGFMAIRPWWMMCSSRCRI